MDNPVRELTDSELDLVSGGAASGLNHLLDSALAKISSTSAATIAAADAQRQRDDRMAALRNAYRVFYVD